MSKIIYLDNAATTQVYPEVLEAMNPYFIEYYGNPSSIHTFAKEADRVVTNARETLADLIHAKAEEIYFTSGGSESDNWALKVTAEAYGDKGKHIITTKIEHHAILHTCEYLEKKGYEVTYLDVDEYGIVRLDELEKAIRPDTILISVMMANNEIGTIQPIEEIGQIAKKYKVLFHTDAVQAFGHIEIDVDKMNIDMLSASGHKINGPKGIGLMYIRKGVKIRSFIHGGAQERARRAGTQNVPGIVGFAKAAELAKASLNDRIAYETKMRDYLIERVLKEIPYSRLNGDRKRRLPNNANFCFQYIEGESLLILLDKKGIYASSGSACTSGSQEPSHVLLAIGLPYEIAHSSLRLTLSEKTTKEEIDFTIDELKKSVDRLRSVSLLYEDSMKKGETVVVGMSGGVDSSVAALLLKEQGYNVIGVTMQIWQDEEYDTQSNNGGCCGLSAVDDAKRVAEQIGIPHYVMNFKATFKEKVIDYFISEYEAGRTPNPCIACNRYVKWESLLQRSIKIGADYIATGHYARIQKLPNGRYSLEKSITEEKDQTYALYSLTQEQLAKTLMPIGEYTKEEVRKIAQKAGLSIASKPDSQDICFIPDGKYGDFIVHNSVKSNAPGNFVDVKGNILGQHKGIVHYTVGQRKGLGIASGERLYVLKILEETNEIVLGEEKELWSKRILVKDFNFVSLENLCGEISVTAKIRYNHRGAKAILRRVNEQYMECIFEEPQRAPTKGQALVCYQNNYVVGGGIITDSSKA